jgi:hypothetical protein
MKGLLYKVSIINSSEVKYYKESLSKRDLIDNMYNKYSIKERYL